MLVTLTLREYRTTVLALLVHGLRDSLRRMAALTHQEQLAALLNFRRRDLLPSPGMVAWLSFGFVYHLSSSRLF